MDRVWSAGFSPSERIDYLVVGGGRLVGNGWELVVKGRSRTEYRL